MSLLSSENRLSGDRLSGDRLSGDLPSGDLPSGDRLSGHLPSGDRLSGDLPSGDCRRICRQRRRAICAPSGDPNSAVECTICTPEPLQNHLRLFVTLGDPSKVVGPKARDVLRTCAAHDAGAGCQLSIVPLPALPALSALRDDDCYHCCTYYCHAG